MPNVLLLSVCKTSCTISPVCQKQALHIAPNWTGQPRLCVAKTDEALVAFEGKPLLSLFAAAVGSHGNYRAGVAGRSAVPAARLSNATQCLAGAGLSCCWCAGAVVAQGAA